MPLCVRENLDWIQFIDECPPEDIPLLMWGCDMGVQKGIRQGLTLQPEVEGFYSHWAFAPKGPMNGVDIG